MGDTLNQYLWLDSISLQPVFKPKQVLGSDLGRPPDTTAQRGGKHRGHKRTWLEAVVTHAGYAIGLTNAMTV